MPATTMVCRQPSSAMYRFSYDDTVIMACTDTLPPCSNENTERKFAPGPANRRVSEGLCKTRGGSVGTNRKLQRERDEERREGPRWMSLATFPGGPGRKNLHRPSGWIVRDHKIQVFLSATTHIAGHILIQNVAQRRTLYLRKEGYYEKL